MYTAVTEIFWHFCPHLDFYNFTIFLDITFHRYGNLINLEILSVFRENTVIKNGLKRWLKKISSP